jgi:hypothetical protein
MQNSAKKTCLSVPDKTPCFFDPCLPRADIHHTSASKTPPDLNSLFLDTGGVLRETPQGRMAARPQGRMAARPHGRMAARPQGRKAAWPHGRMAARPQGRKQPQGRKAAWPQAATPKTALEKPQEQKAAGAKSRRSKKPQEQKAAGVESRRSKKPQEYT